VSRGQRNGSPRPLISVFWTGAATFYSSSSSIEERTFGVGKYKASATCCYYVQMTTVLSK